MNRWLVAAVVGLMAVGCAEGIEDPQPGPQPSPVTKPGPAQTFSGELNEGSEDQGLAFEKSVPDLPPLPNEELPVPRPPTPGE
jgi:hypothetical protein